MKLKFDLSDVSFRFVGEESYSKGSSREYLIGHEPTWWYARRVGSILKHVIDPTPASIHLMVSRIA